MKTTSLENENKEQNEFSVKMVHEEGKGRSYQGYFWNLENLLGAQQVLWVHKAIPKTLSFGPAQEFIYEVLLYR